MRTKTRQLLIFACLVFAFTACNNKQENLLSRKEMTSFLVELHQLDGSLAAKGLGNTDDRSNVYYYNALLNKHGITKAQFDSTLVYYAKNPKKFERVYVDVIDKLTQLDEKVKAGYFHPVDSAALRNTMEEIWPLARKQYKFTTDSTPVKINFVIKNRQLAWKDQYKLSFIHKAENSDSTKNQHTIIRIHYSDKKTNIIRVKTVSDGLTRKHNITFYARRKHGVDSITGAIINYTPTKGKFNALIDSLTLTRKYDLVAQDSIQKAVMMIDNPPIGIEARKELLRLRSKIIMQRKNETSE